MKTLDVSLVQCQLVWEKPQFNVEHIGALIVGIQQSDLIVLPEMFSTGFSMNARAFADDNRQLVLAWMRKTASKRNTAICGSIIIEEGGNYYNRCYFITPDAEFYYDKRHLFSIAGEHRNYTAGKSRLVVEYKGWRIMPQVCYDLRFPVWSRNCNDYDLLLYVANWPEPRRDVWDKLLQARAIENLSVVAGVNRIGSDGEGITYNGGTQFVNERGEVVAMVPDNCEAVLQYSFNLESLQLFREKFPAWRDADNFTIEGLS